MKYPVIKEAYKTTREIKWFRIDWGGTVLSTETITDSTWTPVNCALETDGLTGKEARVLVSGGVAGVPASLTNLIELDTGEVLEAVIQLEIVE